ncbi:MAG TPA: winged helix-turn-helix transcriptional regulator [Anaerohalosphaeraceae bacterium]|nr:winged helix-turn-helix transcriptional regulator [Anaerohalosphaeraceae bacterium]HOL90111.1 winged helix-turn-helix transcriptional regulator [Anaerohalosphaeraceae bacterium]
MNTEIEYVKLPAGLLCCPDLKLVEKVYLGFVYSFNKGGLRLSNKQLGQILGLNQSNISRMIAKLERDGWTKTTGKKTRWRKIYFADSSKVREVLLCRWEQFTLPLGAIYFAAGGKQNKRNKKIKRKTDFSYPCEPSTPEIKPTRETPPDPERVKRVLKDLGFIAEAV